ncbi:hypothetical protein BDD12DRAFT_831210 [Trichophaea hybrida]|nr:hypothetical protein BDD12DRAFT_831210 [Trichophaea hybrida]
MPSVSFMPVRTPVLKMLSVMVLLALLGADNRYCSQHWAMSIVGAVLVGNIPSFLGKCKVFLSQLTKREQIVSALRGVQGFDLQ